MNLLLPPANEVCEGYDFTGVCLSTGGGGGGCLPHCMLGYTPPGAGHTPLAGTPLWQVYPPRQIHPPRQVHRPQVHSPWQVHPPGRYTLPGQVHPPWQVHPPRQVHTPPPPAQCMLGYGQQAGGTHPSGMQFCF